MVKKIFLLLFLSIFVNIFSQSDDPLGLNAEYSMEYFEYGIRALHNTRYELAISEFLKALSFRDDNNLARLYLGEAFRKAGYDDNALYSWNTLLAMGYDSRFLKSRISYLYNRRGMINDIFIDNNYVIRTDIKGYYPGDKDALFLNPSQVAVDNRNHYYIASFTTGRVVELDANLSVYRNVITFNPGLKKPFGVVADKAGNIYVSDFENDRVLLIDSLNIVKKVIGYKGIGEGALLGPKYLALDENENLYVCDSGNVRINKYSKDGAFLFSFGNKYEGKLQEAGGIFIKDKQIFVADRKRNEIVVFDYSGNFLYSFGSGYLDRPYDLTVDQFGRFLIVCEEVIWCYEKENGFWYVLDNIGKRLKRGISITMDNEQNILITDFNGSTLYIMSLERRRWTNMYVNIERILSNKFPDVHLMVNIEKEDFQSPVGITDKNISVFENGKKVPLVGIAYTDLLNSRNDIALIIDNNPDMIKYKNEIKLITDNWIKSLKKNSNFSLITNVMNQAVIQNPLGSTRLEVLDSIEKLKPSNFIDIGEMFKLTFYDLVERFSKKSIVLITNNRQNSNFNKFSIENIISFARNNDIKIYVVSFQDGPNSSIYQNIANRSGGEYYAVYRRNDTKDLFTKIEETKSKFYVFSYRSSSLSRFGKEPIKVEFDVDYSGMKGSANGVYYPPRY